MYALEFQGPCACVDCTRVQVAKYRHCARCSKAKQYDRQPLCLHCQGKQ